MEVSGVASTGSDLASWLREHGTLSVDQAVLFATGLADQLAALHAAGMVHGSLSPPVVRVESAGARIRPALLDRPLRQPSTGPAPADDVYALGVLVRALLDAGGGGPDSVAAPPALHELVARCMAASPADRPAAGAVARALRSVGRDLLLGFAPGPVEPAAAVPGYVPAVTGADRPVPVRRRGRPRRTLLLVTAAVALVLAVTAGTIALVGRHPPGRAGHGAAASGAPGVSGTGTASPRPPSASPVPPRSSPIGPPYLMNGSEVSLNEASGHGCRAWMNGTDPGPYAQAVVRSGGDDCEMALWRSRNGGRTYAVLSGTHRIHTGSEATNYYWAGDIYLARVCLADHTTGQSQCGKEFGGPSPPVRQ
jgi:hypothetical protein